MSNYPPPYPGQPYPPQQYAGPYGGPPPVDLGRPPSAPGRRAGILMFCLGTVILLLAGCLGLAAAAIPTLSNSPDFRQQLSQIQAQMDAVAPGMSIALILGVTAVIQLLIGGSILGLAWPVYRGRRWATVAAIVIVGLVFLYQVLNLLHGLTQVGTPAGGMQVCLGVIITGVIGLQLAWLIGALRAGPTAPGNEAYQRYLAQYYQYQQAAQAYSAAQAMPGGYGQGGGYGYAAPVQSPPPPPSAPMPPPLDPPPSA